MPDLTKNFDQLFEQYSRGFNTSTHNAATRVDLMKSVPRDKGVYLMWEKDSDRPFYIGSAGKIQRAFPPDNNIGFNQSNIRSRLFQATTPYHFDETVLYYGPTTPGVPPNGYRFNVNLCKTKIICMIVPFPNAPSALEHLLIQGFINQFGNLPEANQKI